MVDVDGLHFESTFGPPGGEVYFQASNDQALDEPVEFSDEVIVGSATTGLGFVYRDWFGLQPSKLDLTILLPNRAAFNALAQLRGYPLESGGTPYELHTSQLDWAASLDKITAQGAYLDNPLKASVTFTKIADLGLTAPTGPTTVTAGYVAGPDGLNLDIDLNFGPGPGGSGGTTSSDGYLDDYWIEWGDGSPSDHVTGGPWSIAAGEIPIASHTYAAPSADPSEYVVEITAYRNSVASDPYATVVHID